MKPKHPVLWLLLGIVLIAVIAVAVILLVSRDDDGAATPFSVHEDIHELPTTQWTRSYGDGSGMLPDLRVLDAGPGRALVVVAVDVSGYTATATQLDLTMVDLDSGEEIWTSTAELDPDAFDRQWSGPARVGEAGYVAFSLRNQDEDRQWSSEIRLYSTADGSVETLTVDGYATATMADETLYVAESDGEGREIAVRAYDVEDLGAPRAEFGVTGTGGQELCVREQTLVIGEYVTGSGGSCWFPGTAVAVDRTSGEALPWSVPGTAGMQLRLDEGGLVAAGGDGEEYVVTRLADDGTQVWSVSVEEGASTNGYPWDDFVVITGGDGLVQLDLETGEERWTRPDVEDGRVVLTMPERLLVRADDELLWLDSATGETLHAALQADSDVWSPGASPSYVYLQGSGWLIAYSHDGDEAWRMPLKARHFGTTAGGHLLLIGWDGTEVSLLR